MNNKSLSKQSPIQCVPPWAVNWVIGLQKFWINVLVRWRTIIVKEEKSLMVRVFIERLLEIEQKAYSWDVL